MKAEQQRIAIAEACGWWWVCRKDMTGTLCWGWEQSGKSIHQDDHYRAEKEAAALRALPDYLNDLNAMYEAEKWLKGDTAWWMEYGINLTSICAANVKYGEYSSQEVANVAHATAKQRAEAFLKALNLWK